MVFFLVGEFVASEYQGFYARKCGPHRLVHDWLSLGIP